MPKTLIFAKDDSHADDIVRIAREVFGEGNEFCQKITYRTGFTKVTKKVQNDDGTESDVTEWVKTSKLSPDEILSNFRNDFHPRIAVTVDMISTGTDVKPIECVFFLRNVKSAAFFEQMKGRGVRVISPDKLRTVSRSARAKDRFIIVDAIGVCEDRIDTSDVKEMNFTPAEFETYVLRYGDVPLNEGQSPELVGRPAMYRDEVPGCCYQKTLLRFRAFAGVEPDFALSVFRSYLHNGRFRQSAPLWKTNTARSSKSSGTNVGCSASSSRARAARSTTRRC